MISRITPKIKTGIKTTVLAAVAATMPLKSNPTKYLRPTTMQGIYETDIVTFLHKQNAPLESLVDSIIQANKPKDISLRFPKVPNPSLNMDISATRYEGDPKFLETHLSGVLKGKSQAFCKAQDKYGINATFLIGIANQESGYGKSAVAKRCNNIGGMRTSKGYIKYDSVEECIDSIASNIQRNYVKKGLKTPPQIGKKYCETAAWPKAIVAQMKKIHRNSQCKIFRY